MNRNQITLALLLVVSSCTAIAADSLSKAQAVQAQTHKSSAESQKRIDASAEQTSVLRAEIESLQQEVKNIQVYHDHLSAMVASQQTEMDSFNQQIEQIQDTRQGIVPLMYDMLAGLEQQLADDLPIKLQQRKQRLAKLKALMPQADVSDAEKYRRILEAYQIELDYGTKLDFYTGQIDVDGQPLQAQIVHLGRVSLIARNLNQTRYWGWSQQQKRWQSLPSDSFADLDKAFALAQKQIAPELLNLPVALAVKGGN
ncbi:DUF3450 domain-containing protein [Vibrio sp.]|uniref:DUF3450 domain-containing protein n=1 Tax=Vibrio sp. TaxID=678 RepID=UPI003D106CCE